MYGRAEEITGTLLERLGATKSMFLATKVWTTGASEGLQQFDRSSRLMHRDVLDLEQVHNLVDLKTQLAMLRRKKEQGHVRYVGVTHYTESSFVELEAVMRRERLDSCSFRVRSDFAAPRPDSFRPPPTRARR
jgi:diketogulonate reductase-like aldo/keto reductase